MIRGKHFFYEYELNIVGFNKRILSMIHIIYHNKKSNISN